jgi:hypothetical protein
MVDFSKIHPGMFLMRLYPLDNANIFSEEDSAIAGVFE